MRVLFSGFAGFVSLCLAGSAAAEDVRVMLLETDAPVELAGRRVAPTEGGLSVDQRPVGAVWRAQGRAPVVHLNGMPLRGSLEVRRIDHGMRIVNTLDLESYVAGSLGREIYSSWHTAVLQAQAVVTRTYALYQRARRAAGPFDLEADTRDQVYGGVEAETPRLRAAVDATRGQYLTYRGEPILAAFHAASGGQIASAEEVWGQALPYLVQRTIRDEGGSPYADWRTRISGRKLGRAFAGRGLGLIRKARVLERSPSGRVRKIRLEGSEGSATVTGSALRRALGESEVLSTRFEIRESEGEFVFVGSGHGHGVGMSQWAAYAMARRGSSYREILAAFYPGTQLAGGDRP